MKKEELENVNVYELDYPTEFIDKLPVKFYNIKNMDLSEIDEKYYILFTSDWNWGPHSKMNYNRRLMFHELYLEYLSEKNVTRRAETGQESEIETRVIGFI